MSWFKAFFLDEQVYIEGRQYRCNEILTACLDLPAEKLEDFLTRLWRLVQRVHLSGGSTEELRYFLGCVRQTQDLFDEIGALAAQLPLFRHGELARGLSTPCLPALLDGLCAGDGRKPKKIEDSSFQSNFYYFRIGAILTGMSAARAAAWLNELNLGIAGLLEHYILLTGDILQARRSYCAVLDGYIHKKRAFPAGDELAGCFARYISDSAQEGGPEMLPTHCRVRSSYELLSLEDGQTRLCLACDFDRLRDFFYIDFFHGLARSYLPRRCDNCGQYFLLTAGKYSSYCERPLPDEPGKTCRSIGAKRRYGSKCKNDPVWQIYNRAYKTHYARYMKGKITAPEFEIWSRYAVSLREQAADGTLGLEQYQRLIKE